MENDYFCGLFVWVGVDYIGESMGWLSKGWVVMFFDMCMDEKFCVVYFCVMWIDKFVLKMVVVDYSIDEDLGKDYW